MTRLHPLRRISVVGAVIMFVMALVVALTVGPLATVGAANPQKGEAASADDNAAHRADNGGQKATQNNNAEAGNSKAAPSRSANGEANSAERAQPAPQAQPAAESKLKAASSSQGHGNAKPHTSNEAANSNSNSAKSAQHGSDKAADKSQGTPGSSQAHKNQAHKNRDMAAEKKAMADDKKDAAAEKKAAGNEGNDTDAGEESEGEGADKVGICHATGSDTNPYVFIEVDDNAVPAHDHHQHDEDIIGVTNADACPAGQEPIVDETEGEGDGDGDGDGEGDGADKVGICHATGSDTNPYVFIEVDDNAVPAHDHHQHGEDIIGVTDADACPAGEEPGGEEPIVEETETKTETETETETETDVLATTDDDDQEVAQSPMPTPRAQAAPVPPAAAPTADVAGIADDRELAATGTGVAAQLLAAGLALLLGAGMLWSARRAAARTGSEA